MVRGLVKRKGGFPHALTFALMKFLENFLKNLLLGRYQYMPNVILPFLKMLRFDPMKPSLKDSALMPKHFVEKYLLVMWSLHWLRKSLI